MPETSEGKITEKHKNSGHPRRSSIVKMEKRYPADAGTLCLCKVIKVAGMLSLKGLRLHLKDNARQTNR